MIGDRLRAYGQSKVRRKSFTRTLLYPAYLQFVDTPPPSENLGRASSVILEVLIVGGVPYEKVTPK